MWSKIFKSEPPDVTPPGPFCCAAHRAATRLAPLTRAAATDASGLRPPRSAWQPLPLLPLISPSASYHDSSPALSVDCAAQWGAGRDGAVSPVTGRAAAANSQYGAATRRRAAVPARRRAAMINHSQFCFRGILWFSHKIAPYSVGCPTFGVQSIRLRGPTDPV